MFSLFYLLVDLYDDSEVSLLNPTCISSIWYYISHIQNCLTKYLLEIVGFSPYHR